MAVGLTGDLVASTRKYGPNDCLGLLNGIVIYGQLHCPFKHFIGRYHQLQDS